MQLPLSQLTLDLWLSHRWHNATGGGDPEPQYVRGQPRAPDERTKAEREWVEMTGQRGATAETEPSPSVQPFTSATVTHFAPEFD